MLSVIFTRWTFAIGILKSLPFRDIKPENFLLYKENDDTHIKLIDFGLAKKVS